MTLEQWINSLQAKGRYTFLRGEAITGSGLSPDAVKKALQRLARRGRVVKVKDYFYVIVPLEYATAGAPPASWFIHDLMTAMELPYYVGLLSAAGHHGASHQQPQEFQVVTDRSIRPLVVARTRIRFFASKYVRKAAALEVKTPTGMMRVSTPETTAVDLVRFVKAAGHLDHVAIILTELAHLLDAKRLLEAVRTVGDVPNTQRLGFILDLIDKRRLTGSVHVLVQRQHARVVRLRPGCPVIGARLNRRWQVLVNGPIEADA
jgi:predicted transcriptional regulator of viral defense system